MSLNKYDPRLKKYEELEQTLICGEKILKEFLADLAPDKDGRLTNQFWLLTGPRGSGKSHVLTLLFRKIKNDENLNKLWQPLIFPEELYIVDSLYRLLIEILDRYFKEIENEFNIGDLKNQYYKLKNIRMPNNIRKKKDERYKISKEYFKIISALNGKTGRKLILLLENMQDLFRKQLSGDDLKQLRSFYMENTDVFIIISSALTIFEQIESYGKPFYHFFRIRNIDPLKEDLTLKFLYKIAGFRGDEDIYRKIELSRNYIYTFNILTGGNPRLILLLYELLLDNENLNTELILDKISDLTPYFMDKIKNESEQKRLILDALASGAPAQTATELAEITNEDLQSISGQMKRLAADGWLKEIPIEAKGVKKKENFYILTDYFYRIWYKLRNGSIDESEIYCLAELSTLLFSREEILDRMNKSTKPFYELAYNLICDEKYKQSLDLIFSYALKMEISKSPSMEMNLSLPQIDTNVIYEHIKQADQMEKYKKYMNQGNEFLSKKEYQKAIEAYENALELNFNDDSAWYNIGISYDEINENQKAIAAYERALQINNKNDFAWNNMGLVYYKKKEYKKAIESYENALKIDLKNDSSWNNLGNVYYEQKEYQKALDTYKNALKINRKKESTWSNIGTVYYEQKEYQKAIESYENALKINPDIDWMWNNIGNAYSELKDYQKAIESYKNALKINSDVDWVWNNLGNAYSELKDYQKAIESFKKALKINPGNDSVWKNLGNAYFQLKEYQKVIESLEKGLKINPGNDWVWNNLGNAYIQLKEYQRAIESFEKALKINPDNDSAWSNMGTVYAIRNDYQKSIESYEKALKINPKSDLTLYSMGLTFYKKKEYHQAIESYENALKINPDIDWIWNNIGNAYSELKEYQKAIEAYKNALKLNPDIDLIWNNIGNAYFELKEYQRSIESFEKALKINPDNGSAWTNVGIVYSITNEYQKAIEAYENALKINPEDVIAWSNLGFAYGRMKKYQKAIEAYENALKINPANDFAWYGMGLINSELNEYQKAYDHFSNFIKYCRDFESTDYEKINVIKKSVKIIFSPTRELNILLDMNNLLDSKLESVCRLLLLGKFSAIIDTFQEILKIKSLPEFELKKLEFFLKAYLLRLLKTGEEIKEAKIIFESWLKVTNKINDNDQTKLRTEFLKFLIHYFELRNKEKESLTILQNLIKDINIEYFNISDIILQLIGYLEEPNSRDSQKWMADPLFAEIIKKLSGSEE